MITLVNNGFAYCFKEAPLNTTGGGDLEYNTYVDNISTMMRVSTSKDGDSLSKFDKSKETQAEIKNTSLKHMLINDHQEANRGKIIGQLHLEHTFGFCETFKKITKNLGFYLIFKTANPQDIIYTTIANDINVTINNLYLYVPIFVPSAETKAIFNESIKNNYTNSFDSWYTGRKVVNDGLEFQVDIGSAQNVNSPKYIIAAHQSLARIGVPKKANNTAVFDNLNVRKCIVQIDGARYPKDAIITNYAENDYLDQYRDLQLFYREYVGEELLNPFVSYPDILFK